MPVLIPTKKEPYYSLTVSLDGVQYNLDFSYSTREDCWYLNFNNANGAPMLLGTKIVCQYALFPYQIDFYNLPPGTLIAMSGTNDNSTPGLNDLGINSRVQLFYYSLAEILDGAT